MRWVALLVVLVALLAARSGRASTSSCPSARLVRGALGLTIGPPAAARGAGALTCSYSANGVPTGVVLVFERAGELRGTPLSGLGDAATSSASGSGPFAATTVAVRKGARELSVTAIAPLARVEALAKRLLPLL